MLPPSVNGCPKVDDPNNVCPPPGFEEVALLLLNGTGALEDIGGYADEPTDFEGAGAPIFPPAKGVGAFVDRGGYPDDLLGFTFISESFFVVASTLTAPGNSPESDLDTVGNDVALVALLATGDEPSKMPPTGATPRPSVEPLAPVDASTEDPNSSDEAAAGAGTSPLSENPPAPIDAVREATNASDAGAARAEATPKANPPASLDASPAKTAEGFSDAGAT